ncbi:MAG: hypothetical protein RB148_07700, partial [Armatimonadota bacterium]|nr:hypothetical protein [Armatimonadota bacterium]
GPFLQYLNDLAWEVGFDQQLTVVLPEFVPARWWHFLLHNQNALLIKAALFFRRRSGTRVTVLTDVPFYLSEARPQVEQRFVARPTLLDRWLLLSLGMLVLVGGGLILGMVLRLPVLQMIFGLTVLVALSLAIGLFFLRTLHA